MSNQKTINRLQLIDIFDPLREEIFLYPNTTEGCDKIKELIKSQLTLKLSTDSYLYSSNEHTFEIACDTDLLCKEYKSFSLEDTATHTVYQFLINKDSLYVVTSGEVIAEDSSI